LAHGRSRLWLLASCLLLLASGQTLVQKINAQISLVKIYRENQRVIKS
jgi:hypothetical protein